LACAHRLALAGVPVTVFDAASEPGGVPANVIPRFRIARAELAADVERIRRIGAEFRFNAKIESVEALKAQGFTAIFVGTGAPVPRELPLSGTGVKTIDALAFLEACSAAEASGAPNPFAGVKRVVVAGGGNTAMDAVRVASRIPGIASAALSYRRTRTEMPADKEEFENAMREAASLPGAGTVLLDLTLPETAKPGILVLRRMALGDKDASGRRAPVPSGETFELPCDLLIAAVGETADRAFLEALGVRVKDNGRPAVDPDTLESGVADLYVGGDAQRGPSSIIASEADGRKAAYAMLKKAGIPVEKQDRPIKSIDRAKLARRGEMLPPLPADDPDFLEREAERCLNCGTACLRCVEVCPNRANFAVPVISVKGGDKSAAFRQQLQILHVDVLCNECGNCGLFCPYQGEPFRGKPTLFAGRPALEASKNAGFAFVSSGSKPSLAYRAAYEGAPRLADYSAWTAAAGSGNADAAERSLLALALTVLNEHPYLIGGRA
jgi:putative selenate reductase